MTLPVDAVQGAALQFAEWFLFFCLPETSTRIYTLERGGWGDDEFIVCLGLQYLAASFGLPPASENAVQFTVIAKTHDVHCVQGAS